jgi:hypothetical protein
VIIAERQKRLESPGGEWHLDPATALLPLGMARLTLIFHLHPRNARHP